MSAAEVRIAAARGEAEAHRRRLIATLDAIKQRLAPRSIAHDAWAGAKDKGSEVADSTITAVRQRPAIAAGVAAGAALLLARKPLMGLVMSLFSDSDRSETDEETDTSDKE